LPKNLHFCVKELINPLYKNPLKKGECLKEVITGFLKAGIGGLCMAAFQKTGLQCLK